MARGIERQGNCPLCQPKEGYRDTAELHEAILELAHRAYRAEILQGPASEFIHTIVKLHSQVV